MTTGEWNQFQMVRAEFLRVSKKHLTEKPKVFRSPKNKAFDSKEELDEYQRGWAEYREFCAENQEVIKRAANNRRQKVRLAEKIARETPEYLAAQAARKDRATMVKRERQRWKDFKKRKNGIGGRRLSPDFEQRRLEYQNGCCHYCGCDIRSKFEVDHWMPVALGGVHEEWNLVLACSCCNGAKSDRHPVDFEAQWKTAA